MLLYANIIFKKMSVGSWGIYSSLPAANLSHQKSLKGLSNPVVFEILIYCADESESPKGKPVCRPLSDPERQF